MAGSNVVLKEYIQRDGQDLKVEVYYHLGGMNIYTGEAERRGYYLAAAPVKLERREDGSISSVTVTAFSGYKTLVHEVKRKSDKAAAEALKKADEMREILIERVLEKSRRSRTN